MPIPVYDYRKDIANLVVHPEIRGRFMRMEPAPAGALHSHDLGGEIFLVLEGQCEFIVGDERVTCGPGQLIYVEPRVRHTLHAVGSAPCVVYLSVTPHIEPTHTQYSHQGDRVPPRYGGWRGPEHAADPNPGVSTAELARRYAAAARRLAEAAAANAAAAEARVASIGATSDASPQLKAEVDGLWTTFRSVFEDASSAGLAWNHLAPRAMPPR